MVSSKSMFLFGIPDFTVNLTVLSKNSFAVNATQRSSAQEVVFLFQIAL